MVEVFLPPAPRGAQAGVRLVSPADARTLFEVFANDRDEVIMAILGPSEQLQAVVAFGDVPLERIRDDPSPLVALALGLGAQQVVIAHLADSMVIDGTAELEARRAVGVALEVDDVYLAGWHTMGAQSLQSSCAERLDGLFG
jgi:hypothetical protein